MYVSTAGAHCKHIIIHAMGLDQSLKRRGEGGL
jgi:hypothetical protein